MDMMAIRRRVIMGSLKSGLGEYTKGYYAVLTPSSAAEFVIPHNLGIIPKVCIVEANFEPTEGVNVGLDAVYAFNVYGMAGDAVGGKVFWYYYRNAINSFERGYTDLSFVTESEIRLSPVYSSVRSPWNTNGTYIVTVLG